MGTRKRKTRRSRQNAPRSAPRGIEMFAYTLPGGERVLYVGDALRESDPPAVREGIVRRRLLATEGRCPCGGRAPFAPALVPPFVAMGLITHADDCPAAEENLSAAMRKADGE